MSDLHGCTHGWEDGQGCPMECPDCQIARLTSELDFANRKLADVVKAAESVGWNGVDNPKILTVFIRELARERDEARAVIERLPKTKDNVAIVPSLDVVWWSHPVINPTVHARRVLWSDRYGRWILQGCPEFKPSDAYSTREAAEAASHA